MCVCNWFVEFINVFYSGHSSMETAVAAAVAKKKWNKPKKQRFPESVCNVS